MCLFIRVCQSALCKQAVNGQWNYQQLDNHRQQANSIADAKMQIPIGPTLCFAMRLRNSRTCWLCANFAGVKYRKMPLVSLLSKSAGTRHIKTPHSTLLLFLLSQWLASDNKWRADIQSVANGLVSCLLILCLCALCLCFLSQH